MQFLVLLLLGDSLLICWEIRRSTKHALVRVVGIYSRRSGRCGIRLDYVNVSFDFRIEVQVLAKDRNVEFKYWCEIDGGQGCYGFFIILLGASRRWWATDGATISYLAIFSAHNLIHHKLVNKVGEVLRWWLLILIQESIVGPLCLFKRLDRNFVIL